MADTNERETASRSFYRFWLIGGWILVVSASVSVLDLIYDEQDITPVGVIIRLGLLPVTVAFLANVYRERRNEDSRG